MIEGTIGVCDISKGSSISKENHYGLEQDIHKAITFLKSNKVSTIKD